MVYEYHCSEKHLTTKWRKISERHDPVDCEVCGKPSSLIISKTHCPPDGVYSYAPNIGSPEAFERKRDAIKKGIKGYKVPRQEKYNLTET